MTDASKDVVVMNSHLIGDPSSMPYVLHYGRLRSRLSHFGVDDSFYVDTWTVYRETAGKRRWINAAFRCVDWRPTGVGAARAEALKRAAKMRKLGFKVRVERRDLGA
jgi:hypothetical protein